MTDPLLERREIWRGRIVHLSLDRVRFPDGEEGELELVRHAGAAAVVPFLDSPNDADPRILLIHQYRYASGGHLLEVPAGMPDGPEEAWADCARRELAEETGYRPGRLHYLSRIYTTPGFTDEVIHLFAATDLEPGTTNRDGDEYIELREVRLSEAVAAIQRGELVDGKSVSAILLARSLLTSLEERRADAPPRRGS